jgi:L-seryl-tRNA(Ser) seleniumtransferase
VNEVATSYTNLEYDLQRGSRGHRDQHIEERLRRLLDCEAATVCNNAAAAVFLILNTLASEKKALVSRGELVEIGGSFRIPDIMARSGAILVEVGTTNKTKVTDYVENIDQDTALILRVHQSNYRIIGFTHRPALEELVSMARERSIPLIHDIGSGYLFPVDCPALKNEPTVESSLKAGSDLICFSGDKLLGGPQAGLIVGRRDLVQQVRKNPLMRTFRVDKMTYAALDWTLLQYEQGIFRETIPVWRMISTQPELIHERAQAIKERLRSAPLSVTLREGFSLTGGGSAPEEQIPTWLLNVSSTSQSPNQLEQHLRFYEVPVLSRIEEDEVVLDLRTVFPEQDQIILQALGELER